MSTLTQSTIEERQRRTTHAGSGGFTATHWSVVLAAKDKESPQSDRALETLCLTYWHPLYFFLRRQGHRPHDAQDLVQAFFARLLQKDYLKAVEPERGHFRTFLIMALKRFIANERDRAQAEKRGGGQVALPLDGALAEDRYQEEASVAMAADLAFDRQWAITLLDQTLRRVREEQEQQGKGLQFVVLRQFLMVGVDPVPYGAVARQLGTSEAAAKMAVVRLRRRYRELLLDAIAQTVTSPAEVEEEMRHLFQVLSR